MAGNAFKQPCPSCDHPVLVRDAALVGKKIECPKCKYSFVVQKPSAAQVAASAPAAKAKAPAKPGALRDVDENDAEPPAPPKSSKKRLLGLVLGGVGLLVLGLASYVIFGKGSPPPKKTPPIVFNKGNVEPPDEDDKDKDKTPLKKPDNGKKIPAKAIEEPIPTTPPGPELTNLLPPDSEHVFHGDFKDIFFGPIGEHIIGDRAIADGSIRPHIGFTVSEIDDFLRADRFTGTPWTFTVLHLHAIVDESAVIAAFGLKAMPRIKGHGWYTATKSNPRFDRLSHIAVGVPQWLRTIGPDDARPLYVRFHNPQTLIFADEAPLKALLESNLQFPLLSGLPDGDKSGKLVASLVKEKRYLTIKPKLKDVLERLEARPEGGAAEKILYSAVTELDPARVPTALVPPSDRGKFFWRGQQVWDLTNLLDERKPRITIAGSALAELDAKNYQYRAEFECDSEREARNVLKLADDVIAPEFARNLERYLRLKMEVPRGELTAPKKGDTGVRDTSRWNAALRDNSVDIAIDLVFDNTTLARVQGLLNLFALAAKAEVGLVADARGRRLLGKATVKLAEEGNPERQIPVGSYPPGTFKLPAASRGANTPSDRLSWMTALLPYLGHANLAARIDYNHSWRDPVNWLSARTIVPEFLDPNYPDATRFVMVPGLGVAPATTHIVGIAGVGLDAADYNRDDPALAAKRGVFGYERSATLDDLRKGRGAGNVVMMMQIPYDGLTGVSPWIAGGGATLRGVPEKNSLAPFVLSKDKDGKDITYNGKRGTYAIMADGSVRWLDASISDDVLKALCTVSGPTPPADALKDAPLLPDLTAPKATPKTTPPTPSKDEKLDPAPPPKKVDAGEKKK